MGFRKRAGRGVPPITSAGLSALEPTDLAWLRSHLDLADARPSNLTTISVSDPALADLFGGFPNYAGVRVDERTSMGLSAVYRAVSLVAGTIGTLDMPTIRKDPNTGLNGAMPSVFDDPGGVIGMTPMMWKETVCTHMMLHGGAFCRHIFGGAGQLLGLEPIHPLLTTIEVPLPHPDVEQPVGRMWFWVTMADGTRQRFDARTLTYIPSLSLNGYWGESVITLARNGLGAAIAGDRAAAAAFSNGALINGVAYIDDDADGDEAKKIETDLRRKHMGWENAGRVPVTNRKITFVPLQFNAKDAQFMESRAFSIEEIARWFGVPPHLLMQTEKQTSWGTGVEEQNNGLSRFTLHPWTVRIEQALSRLLPGPRSVRFDFSSLERPTPEDEIQLDIAMVGAGILTVDEARARRNLPPLTPQPAPPAEVAA